MSETDSDEESEISVHDLEASLTTTGEWAKQERQQLEARFKNHLTSLSSINDRMKKTFVPQHTATGRALMRRANLLHDFKACLDEMEGIYNQWRVPDEDEDISTQPVEARAFWIPLLRGATHLGGAATTQEILKRMRFELQVGTRDEDLIAIAPAFNRGNWQRLVTSARRQMLAQNLIYPGPPRGYVSVAKAGQKFLEEWENGE